MMRYFLRHLFGLFSPRHGRLARPDQRVLSPAELRRRILLEQSQAKGFERSGVLLVAGLSLRTRSEPEQFAALIRFCLRAVGADGAVGFMDSCRLALVLPNASEPDTDEIIDQLALGWEIHAELQSLLWVDVTPATFPHASMFSAAADDAEMTATEFHTGDYSEVGGFARRVRDVAIAGAGLILLAPLMLLLALTVKITSPGPIFAVHDGLGVRGRPCRVYRFRARVHEAAVALRLGRASRWREEVDSEPLLEPSSLTSVGSFLHETRLERLPQLWNVLRGDLSL